MRLISLEISNFRVIRKVRLTFPDRVIGIIGPNGAGKSSLIEAVSWALYGNQAARTGRDEIKSGFAASGENCEVTLGFAVNEETYRVVRRLVGKTERAEVELYRGQRAESVGVNETKAYVGELLGLDWKGFLSSFLARQAELNALSDLQPSRRRDHIAGMLGIERLDRAIQRVKDDGKIFKEKADFLERHVSGREQVETAVNELREKIAAMSDPLEKLKREVEETGDRFEIARQSLRQLQKKRDEWMQLRAGIDSESKTVENLTQQLGGLETERQRLQQDQSEVDRLSGALTEYKTVQAELEELKEAKSRRAIADQLRTRQKNLADQKARDEKQMAAIQKKLTEIDARLKTLPESVENEYVRQQEALERARNEFARLRAELEESNRNAERLKLQLDDIASLGPDSVCDRCLRPFGEDYQQIKKHIEKELAGIRGRISEQDSRLAAQKEAGEKLRLLVSELEGKKTERHQLSVEYQSIVRERDTTGRNLEEGRKQSEETDAQIKKLGSAEYDEKQLEKTAAKLDGLEKVRERHDQLKGGLRRMPVVEKSMEELKSKIAASKDSLEKRTQKLGELGFEEETYHQKETEQNEAQELMEEVKSEFLSRSKEFDLVQKELDGKLEQMKGFEKAETQLEETRSAHYHGEKLGRLFAEFRQHLIASIRPSLAEISSRLMAEMTDGRYSLVELDEKYNLRVMDSGVYYGVDRFSGGEKDLANLSLRLAISLALTESAGLTRSFVILDEVFGSQDNQRKELVLKAMGNLKQRFPQILLITHVDDIRDGVEEIIEVLPTGNGWSEVRVNGAAV